MPGLKSGQREAGRELSSQSERAELRRDPSFWFPGVLRDRGSPRFTEKNPVSIQPIEETAVVPAFRRQLGRADNGCSCPASRANYGELHSSALFEEIPTCYLQSALGAPWPPGTRLQRCTIGFLFPSTLLEDSLVFGAAGSHQQETLPGVTRGRATTVGAKVLMHRNKGLT